VIVPCVCILVDLGRQRRNVELKGFVTPELPGRAARGVRIDDEVEAARGSVVGGDVKGGFSPDLRVYVVSRMHGVHGWGGTDVALDVEFFLCALGSVWEVFVDGDDEVREVAAYDVLGEGVCSEEEECKNESVHGELKRLSAAERIRKE